MTTWRPIQAPLIVPDYNQNVIKAPQKIRPDFSTSLADRLRGSDDSFGVRNFRKVADRKRLAQHSFFLYCVAAVSITTFVMMAWSYRGIIELKIEDAYQYVTANYSLGGFFCTFSIRSVVTKIQMFMLRATHLN